MLLNPCTKCVKPYYHFSEASEGTINLDFDKHISSFFIIYMGQIELTPFCGNYIRYAKQSYSSFQFEKIDFLNSGNCDEWRLSIHNMKSYIKIYAIRTREFPLPVYQPTKLDDAVSYYFSKPIKIDIVILYEGIAIRDKLCHSLFYYEYKYTIVRCQTQNLFSTLNIQVILY